MPRFLTRKGKKVGLAPGTLTPVEVPAEAPVRLRLIDYDADRLEERELTDFSELDDFTDGASVTWLNIVGLHDVDLVRRMGDRFELHPLVLEDVVNTGQRPKLEDYEDYLFLTFKSLEFDREALELREQQMSLILGEDWVISLQERDGNGFDPVRERIRSGKGRIRGMGADYLAYALFDAVVDHYFVVLEALGDWTDRVELELMEDPDVEVMHELHGLKRELLYLRRSVWPLREVVAALGREETSMISAPVRVFLRDVYDHTIQVVDTTETFRDMISGMLDIYLSTVGNRMNEVMQVLTIVASIFIPLTFIAGIYGMNFEWMPELGWTLGYPVVLVLMAVIAGGMIALFRARDWI